MTLTYHQDRRPDAEVIRALYAASPLRRPIRDLQRIQRMYEGSNIVLTAFDGPRLIGILRGWTDFAFDGYVCDLAVHPEFQKSGVGRRLLEMAKDLGEDIEWVLRASPIAQDYYKHLGWNSIPNGWSMPRAKWEGTGISIEEYQSRFSELAARA